METKAVIIGTPNSGSAGDEGYLERFAETLRAGGLEVEVWNTERPDHATELAAAAGDKLVIAAGGDGTVNEVVNSLYEGAALGILPLGTANVLARELDLPMKPEDACERILTGTALRMDVGVATDGEGTEAQALFAPLPQGPGRANSRRHGSPLPNLFLTEKGSRVTEGTLRRRLYSWVRESRIKKADVKPHDLRRTFGTWYLQENPSQLIELAELMGHANLSQVRKYALSDAERARAGVAKF